MNRIFIKRIFPFVLAAGLVLGLGGCSQRVPEQGDVPDSIDELSEGMPSDKEEEAQQLEPPQEQSLQQSNEEKNPLEDQLAGEKPEDKPEEEEPAKETEEKKEEESQQTITPVSSGLDTTKLGWGPGGPTDEKNRPSGATAYQEKYGKYDADFIAEDQMKIYLTFDEGYENGYTDDILDVLKEKQTPAVFFVTQPYVEAEPELVQRMIDEGHIVGNHSVNHLSMPTISMEDCRAEVMGLHEYVKENFGYEMSCFVSRWENFPRRTCRCYSSWAIAAYFGALLTATGWWTNSPTRSRQSKPSSPNATRAPSICCTQFRRPMHRSWDR